MLEYARKNDPWPFHADEDEAKRSNFGGIIAAGGYTISLWYRSGRSVWNSADYVWAFLGAVSWQVKFPAPVRPDDRLRVKVTIQNARRSSRAGRGVVTYLSELVNHEGATVFSNEVTILIATRS